MRARGAAAAGARRLWPYAWRGLLPPRRAGVLGRIRIAVGRRHLGVCTPASLGGAGAVDRSRTRPSAAHGTSQNHNRELHRQLSALCAAAYQGGNG